MRTVALGAWGELFMLQVLVTAPLLGIISYIRIQKGKIRGTKIERYRRVIAVEVIFLLLAFFAAREQHVPLLPGPFPSAVAWIAAAFFLTVFAFQLRRAWAKLSPQRLERASLFIPDDLSQMRLWVVISAMAGITEEIVYRGLAFRFLTDNRSPVWLALLLCIVAFAVAHMTQGVRALLGTAFVAAALHAVVFQTQSLYLAIVVHAIYDLMVGIIGLPVLHNFMKSRASIPAPEVMSS